MSQTTYLHLIAARKTRTLKKSSIKSKPDDIKELLECISISTHKAHHRDERLMSLLEQRCKWEELGWENFSEISRNDIVIIASHRRKLFGLGMFHCSSGFATTNKKIEQIAKASMNDISPGLGLFEGAHLEADAFWKEFADHIAPGDARPGKEPLHRHVEFHALLLMALRRVSVYPPELIALLVQYEEWNRGLSERPDGHRMFSLAKHGAFEGG